MKRKKKNVCYNCFFLQSELKLDVFLTYLCYSNTAVMKIHRLCVLVLTVGKNHITEEHNGTLRATFWEDVFGQPFAACMELPELGASPNKGHEGHRSFPHKGLFLTPRDFGAFQFLTWPGVLKPGQYHLYQWLSLDVFQWEQSGLPLIWVCFRLFKQYQLPMPHFQLQIFFFWILVWTSIVNSVGYLLPAFWSSLCSL